MLDRAQYDQFRVSPPDPATLRCDQVEAALKKLVDSSDRKLRLEKLAESIEGRPIYLATIGSGQKRVLMWSQMHGDEPTHTAVVLDLLSYFLRTPAEPLAADILTNCTLLFIPMLNPDGAEQVARFNAQGIDINRDWRRLATPEGRALKRAAETLKPQFAFNLHNQNARTTVGRPPRPAAVSVLAPAPNGTRTESPSMSVGKQMCSCFVEAVRPHAQGMISRYDDAYEPRAFGDGIQSLGISTMLVEAGGWPNVDPEPMTRLHFHGMLNTLHAIATDKYRQADVQVYEALPESNSTRPNDCRINKARILDGKVDEPFVADLIIDQSHSVRLAFTQTRDGKFTEIGDLPGAPARLSINASNKLVLPGHVVVVGDWMPGTPLEKPRLNELLASGTTTVIGTVNLADRDAIESMTTPHSMPINWGFIANADELGSIQNCDLVERIAIAAAAGLLAVVSKGANESLWRTVHQLGLPLLKPSQLPTRAGRTYHDAAQQAWNTSIALGLQSRRGRINRDYLADLLLFEGADEISPSQPVDWRRLDRVMVAGEPVWENGKRLSAVPGTMLQHS